MSAALQGPAGRTNLGSTPLTIGRTPDNQLVITDPKASSRHATIGLGPQGYILTDLGSTNGTFVNEQRLEPHVPRLLYAGDRVRFGDTTYTYEDTGQSSPGIAPSANPYEYTSYGGGAASPAAYQATPAYEPLPPTAYAPLPGSANSGFNQPPLPSTAYAPLPGSANSGFDQAGYMPPPPVTPYGQPIQPLYNPGAQGYPPQIPYMPPTPQKKSGGGAKIVLIVLAVVLVLAIVGGSITAFVLANRPQPTIGITSVYKSGTTIAGAAGTILHATGSKFSSNSAITFLLDNSTIPGIKSVQSDGNGNLTADLMVSNDWSVGTHTLTAKDASGYTTQTGVTIAIVTPGQSQTPGPNGAPTDSANFSVKLTVQRQNSQGQQLKSFDVTLTVTGGPDGGKVCQNGDNGQPQSFHGTTTSGTGYDEAIATTCNGSYKTGKITYTEVASSDKITFADGSSCTAQMPYNFEQLTGTFTSSTAVNGTYSGDAASFTCSDNSHQTSSAEKGTWTGDASVSGGNS